MREGIHPEYREVVFEDVSTGDRFITRSTIRTDRTVEWTDGRTYPLFQVEVSNTSHPFFTGQMKIIDTAGRVERFKRRHGDRTARRT
jgi:large subunit ribosomal protein L31